MILGTVQLGLKYGIHNSSGKPSEKMAYNILNCAYENGIHVIDTAAAYGESETLIGNYMICSGNNFNICTKTLNSSNSIEEDVYLSLERLKAKSLYICYLHRFEHCQDSAVLGSLLGLKDVGVVERIGVSVYEPHELNYILEELSSVVNVVQIPYNLLDCFRWDEKGLLKKAKEKGITIYARSLFLQGLLFMDPELDMVERLQASESLKRVHLLAREAEMNISELAVGFVMSHPYIDDFIIGCETVEQLEKDIELINNSLLLSCHSLWNERIQEISMKTSDIAVDPRKWNL